MDFAIAPVCQTGGRRADDRPGSTRLAQHDVERADFSGPDFEWAVLCLHTRRGLEVAQHLAQFGHRSHAEAFLADLLACAPALAPAGLR
jgi:hypothetical protein